MWEKTFQMKNIKYYIILLSLLHFLLSCVNVEKPQNEINGTKLYKNSELGMEFSYPEKWVIGRYLPEEYFEKHIVLVEPSVLGNIDPDSIPVGQLPIISLNIQRDEEVLFSDEDFKRFRKFNEIQVIDIGEFEVYKLPGYPGPYGINAFYYLIQLSNSDVLEIYAHNHYFKTGIEDNQNFKRTNYDIIIEKLIGTIKFR
jgi:hypothetical protein